MPNPKIEPIEIGNLRIVDSRDVTNVSHQGWAAARSRKAKLSLIDFAGIKPEIPACESPEQYERGLLRWEALLETQPDLTWEDFIQGGGMFENQNTLDRRLPFMLMTVFDLDRSNRPSGSFTIINMTFETETPLKIEASGHAVLMADFGDSGLMLRQWGRVMRHFLDEDIPLQGGQVLDIVGWDFGTDFPWIENADRQSIIARTVLDECRRVGLDESLAGPTLGVERVRRDDAPRRISLPDRQTPRDARLPTRRLTAVSVEPNIPGIDR